MSTKHWDAVPITTVPPNTTTFRPPSYRQNTVIVPIRRNVTLSSTNPPVTTKSLPAGRYKIRQGYLCLVAKTDQSGVYMGDCGEDGIGWTWDPQLGTWMMGSDSDSTSFGAPQDKNGPRWYLGTTNSTCSDVTLVSHTGPPPNPNTNNESNISGWTFNGLNLTLTTCSSTTCMDTQHFNTINQIPTLNGNCSATTNTMQWNIEPYQTTTVSGTGKLIASLIVAAVGFSLFLLNRWQHRVSNERRLANETKTEQLLNNLAKI